MIILIRFLCKIGKMEQLNLLFPAQFYNIIQYVKKWLISYKFPYFTMKIGYVLFQKLRYHIRKGTFTSYYTSGIYSQAQAMHKDAWICAVRPREGG